MGAARPHRHPAPLSGAPWRALWVQTQTVPTWPVKEARLFIYLLPVVADWRLLLGASASPLPSAPQGALPGPDKTLVPKRTGVGSPKPPARPRASEAWGWAPLVRGPDTKRMFSPITHDFNKRLSSSWCMCSFPRLSLTTAPVGSSVHTRTPRVGHLGPGGVRPGELSWDGGPSLLTPCLCGRSGQLLGSLQSSAP